MINNFKTELKEISKVFEFVRNGKSIKQVSNRKGVPITRIETISKKFIDVNKLGYADVDTNNLGNFENYLLKEGDILMSHINSPKHLGKTAIYKNIPKELIHGMNLLCLRNKENICNSNYAHYYFQSNYFFQDLQKISNKSVNQASFSVGKLKELKIPLPPLETQKQIAQTLDNAAALRDKTQQLLAEYNQLAESIFLDMFGDPVLNKKSWKIKKVQDISEIVTKGSSPKWQGFGYIDKGVRFVTSENVRMGYLDCSQDKFVALDFHKKLKKSQLKQNDLLVNLVGASIGRGALVTSEILPANINQAVAKIEPKQDLVNHLFLLHLVITKQMQDRLIGNKVEGARANISLTNVRELEIIYPPIELQNQFAEKIALIEQQKDLAKKELQESEDLFQVLLQKAFCPAEKHDESELV